MEDLSLTFNDVLVDFLEETGIPSPDLFAQAQVYFNNVDVDLVDKECYWSRMFCCAATGSYNLESGNTISVSISSH